MYCGQHTVYASLGGKNRDQHIQFSVVENMKKTFHLFWCFERVYHQNLTLIPSFSLLSGSSTMI